MATTAWNRRLEPCYKQYTAVDDERGVVLDVVVTTGEVNEGDLIEAQVDTVQEIADRPISTVTADAGYAYGKVYGGLERRDHDNMKIQAYLTAAAVNLKRLAAALLAILWAIRVAGIAVQISQGACRDQDVRNVIAATAAA